MKKVIVAMPFSEGWSDKVWDMLFRMVQKDSSKTINMVRVDMIETPEDRLSDKIEALNKEADIIVADITGSNPNVLIEVGIALANDTPLLLITQNLLETPTHLRGRIIEEYNPDDDNSLEGMTNTILLRIMEKIQVINAKTIEKNQKELYSVQCYSRRSVIKLEEYFQKAKWRIDILTTNLSFLFEEYGDGPHCYFDKICSSLDKDNSKTKVRILTLDPESDFAAKRGKQLGYSPALFRNMLRDALNKTRETARTLKSNSFEIRTYDDFPTQITYRIDDYVFHCVVAQPTQSRNHLTFKLDRRQSGVDVSFVNHFQTIWGRAQELH